MAKDDMEVIIYKILRYLYDCNKNGKVPTFSDMFSVIELPMISLSYLGRIVSELIEKGYISGCDVTNTKNGVLFHLAEVAWITLDGGNYTQLIRNGRWYFYAHFQTGGMKSWQHQPLIF